MPNILTMFGRGMPPPQSKTPEPPEGTKHTPQTIFKHSASAKSQQNPHTMTVPEARLWLQDHLQEGSVCPCCNQNVKLYHRKLNSSMARGVIFLYYLWKENPHIWWDVTEEVTERNVVDLLRSREWPKAKYWGLLEQQPGKRSDGAPNSAKWRITEKGIQFVLGAISVPSHAIVYNSRCRGLEGDDTTIQMALGEKFSYNDLMREV